MTYGLSGVESREPAQFLDLGSLEDAESPAKLVAATVAQFGRIDALVNNAAVIAHGGIEDTDLGML